MPKHRLRIIRLFALLLVLAIAAAACGSDDSGDNEATTKTTQGDTSGKVSDEGTPVPGGTLRFGQESDVATLDPSKALAQPADKNIALAVYDSLMTFDDESNFVPGLAESLTPNDALTEYTMKLRQGIQFQDGTPFNADAVVFHFNRQKDPATNCTCASDVAHITKIDKVDDYTVKFTLDGPQVAFANLLAGTNGYIPSPAAIQKYGKDYDQHPVGTGPFMLTEFVPGDRVVVKKNPNYWRKDKDGNKLPYLDEIVFKPIPDSKQRINALKAGDVDMIQSADTSIIKPGEEAGFKVQKISGSSSTIIMLNNAKPPMDDRRVRQAMAYALNKDAMNKAAWGGVRELSYSSFATSSPYYVKGIGTPKYDPAKAKELLKEYGKPVEFTAECIPTPEADTLQQLAKQMWEAVGMKVTLKSTEQGQYVNRIFGSKDYTVACFRSNQMTDPDQLYTSLYTGSAVNLLNYSNPKVDKALDEGRTTADVEKRKEAYKIVQEELAKDVPAISLAYDLFVNIYSKKVHGLPVPEGNSLGAIKTAGIWMSK